MDYRNRMHFRMMSFIHETMYGLFRDADKALIAAGLVSGQKVLEVGCGPGFFTIPAARIVGEAGSVLSVEINPLAVRHVQQKIKEARLSNVKVILSNAAQTDLPDQGFDLAFLFGLAHIRGDKGKIWSEMHRFLKPKGILSVEGRLRPPEELFRPTTRQKRICRYEKAG